MRSVLFIGVVLVSGALGGLVQSGVNLALVEPHLDGAILDEARAIIADGAEDSAGFWTEHDAYRAWQKGGLIVSGVVLGTSVGALFGIIYAISRSSLPGGHDVIKALVLAGVMWAVLFLVPFLKYPAVLPGEGDADTVGLRAAQQLILTAVSGVGALGFYWISRRMAGAKKLTVLAGYISLMGIAFVLMPGATQTDGQAPFQAASALGVASFWVSAALILGALWGRFRPDLHVREPTR